MPRDDAVLVRRSRAGDGGTFGLLFEQYKNLVYRTAFLIVGTAADAEDILQEVFLQVYRALDTYDPARGSFGTWIHRITVNCCLNWRRGRRPTDRLEGREDRAESLVCLPDEGLANRDSVHRALSVLSHKLRVVVVLRYYWDFSYADIAEMLDLPLGTVKSRLNLAMHQMKDQLGPGPQDQGRFVVEAER